MNGKLRGYKMITSLLYEAIHSKRPSYWIGFITILVITIACGYAAGTGLMSEVTLMGSVFGLIVVGICVFNPEVGLYVVMGYGFFAYHISRLLFNDELQLGIGTDILVGTTLVGVIVRNPNIKENATLFFTKRPTLFFFVVFLYLCIQIFNPLAASLEGWFQVIRKVLASLAILFITFSILDNLKAVKRLLTVLFIFAVLSGAYACIQQWHGLFSFEEQWVKSDPVRFGLIFINGDYRKFSIMADPTAFGIIMASCSLLFILLSIYEKKNLRRFFYIGGCVIMLLGMAYSGTRTANVMFIAGLGIFLSLTIHKTATRLFALFCLMLFLFLMYVPIYSNVTLLRFRSSFKGSQDMSYNVREMNRAHIQPYIYGHPFGGGLSTTGGNGVKYNPNHFLAGFPPDSGYLSKALETGWIGLALTCVLYFVTLQYSIRGYFASKRGPMKAMFAAMTAFLFSFYVGEIVQEAVGQFTNMVVYYPIVALIVRLRILDGEKKADESV